MSTLNRNFSSQKIDRTDFKKGLTGLMENIENCIDCLSNEDDASYRRLLRDRAKVLKTNIKECLLFIDYL